MLKSFIDLAEGRTRTLKPSPAPCFSSHPVLDRGEMGEEGGRDDRREIRGIIYCSGGENGGSAKKLEIDSLLPLLLPPESDGDGVIGCVDTVN